MKKIISFVLLAAFVCATIIGAGSVVFSALLGDTNGDTEIDNKDVVALFRYASGNKDSAIEENCDINRDGEINNKDVVELFRAVSAGVVPTDTEEPTEEETEEPTEEETEEPTEEVTEEPTEETTEEVTEEETQPEEPREYAQSFTVSRAISKDMVLQRNEPIRIWGWAPESEEGKYVRAEFSGLTGEAQIVDGAWLITLSDVLPACTTPKDITVSGGTGEDGNDVKTVITNVLVGDVYWIAGQSNIYYPVSAINSEPLAPQEAKNVEVSNDMLIRLNRTTASDLAGITLGTNDVSEDVVNRRGWQKPKRGALAFSALGYYTAVKLYNALEREVPIGMIEFDGNGMALHGFLPNEVRDALNVSTVDANGVYSAPGVNPHASSYMYNHAMYSFQNMPIAGFIWYQGESDCSGSNDNCYAYAQRFTAMINYIRDKHDQINHDYPVYIVELSPSFQYSSTGQANQYIDFATVRMNMGSIPTMLANAHICSTEDLWKDQDYNNNLHPYNKWEIAERMKKLVLAYGLGIGDPAEAEGPIVESFTVSADGKTATVKFRNVGKGLVAQGGVLKGFKVATSTSKYSAIYEPSSAVISGTDTVVLTYTRAIKKVAYNNKLSYTFPEAVTLCNSGGIPCAAFILSE